MDSQELRRIRRRARQAMRIREWPWRRKVALGAWVPVAVAGFILFTGPNGSPSGATTDTTVQPRTITTVKVPPPKLKIKEAADQFRAIKQTQEDVKYWVDATPNHLTLQQQVDKAKWYTARRKELLRKHKAAVASSHHRDQKTN